MIDVPRNTILCGDVLDRLRELPDSCVQTVCTSPPYFGLRDYGTATWDGGDPDCDHTASVKAKASAIVGNTLMTGRGTAEAAATARIHACPACGARRIDQQIGLEPTPAAYVARMVEVFREVRRVLRNDGTCWVNMGDSYANEPSWGRGDSSTLEGRKQSALGGVRRGGISANLANCLDRRMEGQPLIFGNAVTIGITGKRRDVALQNKRTPDSVFLRLLGVHRVTIKQRDKDFCQVLHTLNSDCYCWIAAPLCSAHRDATNLELVMDVADNVSIVISEHDANGEPVLGVFGAPGRNKRSVWTVATEAYPDAHFATFPRKLIEPCILAGSSPQACETCGAPWRRVVGGTIGKGWHDHKGDMAKGQRIALSEAKDGTYKRIERGWRPTCRCPDNTGAARSLVLDPFMGSGTVALVAQSWQRDYLGIELNPAYIEMAQRRLSTVAVRLFADGGAA